MNIHEHQAKEILKEFGAPVSNGFVVFSVDEIPKKIIKLNSKEFVLKAQIHAGGRGKAGGVKLVKTTQALKDEAKKMMGKILITHQTGPNGKEVKRLYVEEASNIEKEYYLSCLIARDSSKIAFISSIEGGMDIEKIASENPEKIITNKIDLKSEGPQDNEIENIISVFNFMSQRSSRFFIKQSLFNLVLRLAYSVLQKYRNTLQKYLIDFLLNGHSWVLIIAIDLSHTILTAQ